MKMSENCTQMSLFPEMEESISSPVASPARTFRLPEIRKELRQREVDSFSRLPGSPMRSSPIAELDPRLCWRTSQTSLLETGEVGQEPYTGSWPSEGIVLNGKLWEQPMWGHLTGGSDGGQSVTWPTPSTLSNLHHPDREVINNSTIDKNGTKWGASLIDSVMALEKKKWPTPRATEYKGGRTREGIAKTGRNPLTNTLSDAVKVYEEGQLNADWVEWLMGYPTGWTNLETSPE